MYNITFELRVNNTGKVPSHILEAGSGKQQGGESSVLKKEKKDNVTAELQRRTSYLMQALHW